MHVLMCFRYVCRLPIHQYRGGLRPPPSLQIFVDSRTVDGEAANAAKTHENVYQICVDLCILRISYKYGATMSNAVLSIF